ncbi:acyl-CoA dehydrogenase family protein [Nocardia sp. alder85J]|uniref:acyl-CoA dehydrogenase family protein n=1 Tax=Nocardia sp. alder85J TaxID=2862949 RepID=UPI001CD37B09|nr:acyl-CoA dehydrogenase family protein [Nocardia sp. alder85J]MCX4095749.1 acyl-CoA dehydrogenase family protein [Nocardia sp. alder85J]
MNTALIPPYRALPPEVAALRGEVRAFLDRDRAAHQWTPHVDSWISSWDPAFSERLAEHGWLGMTVPVEYGGHGRSHIDRFVVTEELLAAGAPVAAHWVADRQVVPALLSYGTDEQRQRYLPEIAAGRCFFAIGMSEPESGSDLASVRTRAVPVDGGWELTGTKVWTSGAHHAHAFFVLARSAPLDPAHRHDGLSQFVVPLDSPGIEIRPIRLLTGQHHFNEVVLDHVFVPDSMVLGTPGQGWRQVSSELGFERSGPERILSTQPLLNAFADRLAANADVDPAAVAVLGGLVARLSTLRQLSATVATALSRGASADLPAALVKDLGTRYEGEVVEAAATSTDVGADPHSPDDFGRLLAEGLLHTPGFTLRGGTSEILRGVVARGLGLR